MNPPIDLIVASRRRPGRPRRHGALGGRVCSARRGYEERRTVSVLFVDMVGFTAYADRLDPEDVRALQHRYFRTVRMVVRRWCGVVEKYVGDAVLAVFGAPRSDENDALRAVHAGLAIREALAGIRGPDGAPIRVRVGIATGEALVDLSAVHDGGQAMVTGDVVNTAARVQAHAPTGTVVVTTATRVATAGQLRYATLPPVAVAGKAAPIPLWRALGPARRSPQRRPRDGGTPMVGRQIELTELVNRLRRAVQDGRPQAMVVAGPAGIGKSRLVLEAARRVEAVRWVGSCHPCGGGPAWALAEMAKTAAVPASELATAERCRRLILTTAARHPLVLVVEDVTGADPETLGFLRDLLADAMAAPGPLPLAIVVTRRPEAPVVFPDRPHTTVVLRPLDRAGSTRLLEHLLDRAGRSRTAIDRLLPLVAGNPRYAEEYVRVLGETSTGEPPVPEFVRRVVSARLDRVGDPDRAVLQAAAVLGDAVWPGAVARMLDTDPIHVSSALRRLEGWGLVVRRSGSAVPGQPEYTFQHAAVRQVAYGRLPRTRRIDLHRRAAQWWAGDTSGTGWQALSA